MTLEQLANNTNTVYKRGYEAGYALGKRENESRIQQLELKLSVLTSKHKETLKQSARPQRREIE